VNCKEKKGQSLDPFILTAKFGRSMFNSLSNSFSLSDACLKAILIQKKIFLNKRQGVFYFLPSSNFFFNSTARRIILSPIALQSKYFL